MTMTYKGQCFCGAVQLEVTGEPVAMGICHCGDCRSWAAAPINAFTLWRPEAIRVTDGADRLATYHKTERSYRKFCTTCGGHVMTDHPHWNLVDVYAATLPELAHAPAVHVHYQESVFPIRDGMPKMRDLPAEMGGSGMTLPE